MGKAEYSLIIAKKSGNYILGRVVHNPTMAYLWWEVLDRRKSKNHYWYFNAHDFKNAKIKFEEIVRLKN